MEPIYYPAGKGRETRPGPMLDGLTIYYVGDRDTVPTRPTVWLYLEEVDATLEPGEYICCTVAWGIVGGGHSEALEDHEGEPV